MPNLPTAADREAFYAAALVGLRALDARERVPRRFGPEADSRWGQFKGALGLGDRLDLLLRDGAVTWGAAFSPALVFGLFGLADDEPFGPDWPGLSDDRARRMMVDGNGAPDLVAAARALGIQPAPVEVPPLSPSTRLVVAGGAAILAVADRFSRQPELSWSDQVVVVAENPAHRQLAGLAPAILGARGRAPLVRPSQDVAATLKEAGFGQVDAAVVSSDAGSDAARFAHRAVGKV